MPDAPVRSWIGIVALTLLSCINAVPCAAAGRPPNVVLILADDIGFADYGCYGGEISTPNIDRLAREGLRFMQFYNNAVCVPTRASLLTGLSPRYLGKPPRIGLSRNMITLAELLKQSGYQTSLSGKWHLGSTSPHRPIDRGFDEYYGLADGCCNYFDPARRDPPFEGGDGIRDWMHNDKFIREFPADFYSTDAIAAHACGQVRRFAAANKPFFVHVCFTAAHSPLHAKPADIAKYKGRYAIGWDALRRERRERQLKLGVIDPRWPISRREPEFPAWEDEPLKEWHENLMAVYAAMIDSMDQNIGRILDALRETGEESRTVVIMLNDNGGCSEQAGGNDPTNIAGPKEHYVSCGPGWAYAQNTPFRRCKAWVHEGGISTPCIVRWPGVTVAGASTPQVGHVIDLWPTIQEIAGASDLRARPGAEILPAEGISLVSVLRGGKSLERGPLYWASLDNRAMRQGSMKLAWDQNVRRWELYDLAVDRSETNDLAPSHPDLVATMAADWTRWAERTGAIHRLGEKYRPIPPAK